MQHAFKVSGCRHAGFAVYVLLDDLPTTSIRDVVAAWQKSEKCATLAVVWRRVPYEVSHGPMDLHEPFSGYFADGEENWMSAGLALRRRRQDRALGVLHTPLPTYKEITIQ